MTLPPVSPPPVLPPCGSGRRRVGDSSSPEFEFWMVRNPSIPQPNLLSADELFSDGFLLPLHLLNHSEEPAEPEASRAKETESASPRLISSKRWTDIFRKSDRKISRSLESVNADEVGKKDIGNCSKEKKREKKKNGTVNAGSGLSAPELNINIWPFSRSRSAGNGASRPRIATATRKASSAPCSRSNSAGESKSKRWPSSPNRAGVHLGRSSPVWQVRRSGGGRVSEKFLKSEARRKTPSGSKRGALSFNVPRCIGYRNQMGCRSEEMSGAPGGGEHPGDGSRGSNLFNIRSLFTRKVY